MHHFDQRLTVGRGRFFQTALVISVEEKTKKSGYVGQKRVFLREQDTTAKETEADGEHALHATHADRKHTSRVCACVVCGRGNVL